MSNNMVQEMIDAGIHFGHRASRWNPKMRPYIFSKRGGLHIIDVKETLRGLLLAKKFLTQVVTGGKDVLFVGTKRQARKSIETHAERVGMHWVTERWLGGTLTNFREIRKRVARLEQLEAMDAEGTLDAYSKKEGSRLRREMKKIRRNLNGLRTMTKFPGAIVVIDATNETITLKEARKAGIPIVALIDTDANPDLVDIPIPGNDDAMRSIEIVVRELANTVDTATKHRGEGVDKEGDEKPAPKRRSQRETTARAEEAAPVAAEEVAPVAAEEVAPVAAEEVAPVAAEEVAPVAAEEVAPVAAEEVAPVAAEEVAPVAAEEVAPVAAEEVAPATDAPAAE